MTVTRVQLFSANLTAMGRRAKNKQAEPEPLVLKHDNGKQKPEKRKAVDDGKRSALKKVKATASTVDLKGKGKEKRLKGKKKQAKDSESGSDDDAMDEDGDAEANLEKHKK